MSPSIILRREENKAHAIKRIQAIKPDEENPLAIWIGPYRKIRSLEQNALYFKLIGLVADATGHSRDALHQFFKREAFGVQVQSIGERTFEFVPSSATVSRGDFGELIEHVQRFIAEHGIEEQA